MLLLVSGELAYFMGNHCRLGGSMKVSQWRTFGDLLVGIFLHGRMPCINSIKNTEGRRNANVTIVTNRKSRPQADYFRTTRYLYSISISGFCLLLLHCLRNANAVTSDCRFRTFVKEKLLNIQLMRTNNVLQHIRVHADSEYYHVCVGEADRIMESSLSVTNKFTYSQTNKQTHKHWALYITYPIMHSSRWHNLALAAVFPVSCAKPTTGKVLLQTNGTKRSEGVPFGVTTHISSHEPQMGEPQTHKNSSSRHSVNPCHPT